MLLGRVTGTLVASRKDEGLAGQKFLVVREIGVDGKETGGHVVAADSVGAGVGEVVLWASGSAARQSRKPRSCSGGSSKSDSRAVAPPESTNRLYVQCDSSGLFSANFAAYQFMPFWRKRLIAVASARRICNSPARVCGAHALAARLRRHASRSSAAAACVSRAG